MSESFVPASLEQSDLSEDKILRVKGSSAPGKTASAISHALYDNHTVVLRAIGAGAVNQAAKAIAIAGGYVATRGLAIACRIGFTTVKMPDGEISAMVFRIFTV